MLLKKVTEGGKIVVFTDALLNSEIHPPLKMVVYFPVLRYPERACKP